MKYCIAWTNTRDKTHTGPVLVHPEYAMRYEKAKDDPGTILTKEEAEAKAKRINDSKFVSSHHWAIPYRGKEWKEINSKQEEN